MSIRLSKGGHYRTVVCSVSLDGTLGSLINLGIIAKSHFRMVGLRLIDTFVKCGWAGAGIYKQRLFIYSLTIEFQIQNIFLFIYPECHLHERTLIPAVLVEQEREEAHALVL